MLCIFAFFKEMKMSADKVKCLVENFCKRLFESNLIEAVCCGPNMPLYGARLIYLKHISRQNLSSLPNTFKPFKLISQVISYIDDVTGATEIREAHTTLKQVTFSNISSKYNISGAHFMAINTKVLVVL